MLLLPFCKFFSCIVLVATVRALKYNGGVAKADLNQPNMDALKHGICNLDAHLDNMKKFGVPVVVAVNAFPTDTDEEMDFIREHCAERGVRVALSEVFAKGGEGGQALADEVLAVLDEGKAEIAAHGRTTSLTRSTEQDATALKATATFAADCAPCDVPSVMDSMS